MRLTLHTDHAMRLLMLLTLEPDQRHTAETVARRYRISQNHLSKIVQTLTHAGFVEAARGRSGGLRLGLPASGITLGAVVRATEDNFTLVECFDTEHNGCVVTPACRLRKPLNEALQAFLAVLDRYTLKDIVGNRDARAQMLRLLEIPAEAMP